MYSDKFVQGYVMSSRLYRKEVWPFLSDAARNVYAELENRINGHNKESDFVSYSQLQGGELKGSRKMGRTSVSNALQELIKLGVVTVIANGKRGMKSYRINEVSLKDQPTNKTSPINEPVQQQDQNQSTNKTKTSPTTGHTIDNSIDSLENNNKAPEQFSPQNRPMLQFIEYRLDDQQAYTLRELTQKYPAQSDFTAQAKISFPKLTDEQINGELRNLAQWSMTAEKRISQKWMTTWLNWLKNFENAQNKTQQKSNQPKAQKQQPKKAHRFGQGVINP